MPTITKAKFLAYERVRQSGVTNMLSPLVQSLADLTKDEHLDIIKNYGQYADLWLSGRLESNEEAPYRQIGGDTRPPREPSDPLL